MEPQLIPAGFEEMVPEPLPALVAVKVLFDSNLAVAVRSPLMIRLHVPVPEQLPDQPVKLEPAAAVAVRVTGTAANGAEQVEPQLIPAGLEVTVPAPEPALVTVSV